MENKKLIWVVVLLLSINLVLAIGIRPAKTTILFDELSTSEGNFWVVNNENREFLAKVSVAGEMAEYITLVTKELAFAEDTDAKEVAFLVNLPDSVPPGQSIASIIIEENIPEVSSKTISSKVIMKHKIMIRGPYPDKFIKSKLNFQERKDHFELVSEINNLGKQQKNSIQTKFYINDKKQQERVLKTEKTSLDKKENKLLKAKLEKKFLEQGEIEVRAVTIFDNQKIEVIKNLLVGEPEIEVTYFDKYFVANKINKYSIELLNKWNKEIENVFVDVVVKKDDTEVDEFRTKSMNLGGLMVDKISDYYDTTGKIVGSYTFDLIVNYWNTYKMEAQTFQGEIVTKEDLEFISENNVNVKEEALMGNSIHSGKNGTFVDSKVFLLVGIICVLFLIIMIYVTYRYRHREEYEGYDEIF